MKPFVHQRPQSAQVILDRLPYLQRVLENAEPLPIEQRSFFKGMLSFLYLPSVIPVPARLIFAGLSDLVVILVLLLLRSVGGLQTLELRTYDQLFRTRPLEPPDNRLVVVTVNSDDRAFQEQLGFSFRNPDDPFYQSVSDDALEKMLIILEEHQPRAIGLDINLDYLRNEQATAPLLTRLRTQPNVISGCRGGKADSNPFPGVALESLGLVNFPLDPDKILRRHLFIGNVNVGSACKAVYSFSLILADLYFEQEGIVAEFDEAYRLSFNGTPLQSLSIPASGYQKLNISKSQLLLNYRSVASPKEISEHLSLTDILEERFDPDILRDRIVLVGIARSDSPDGGDYWLTPWGIEVPGVFIHAHKTSQLLSAVLDGRPLISTTPQNIEISMFIGLALLGGSLAIISTRTVIKLFLYLVVSVSIVTLSFIFFIEGVWLPMVPSMFGFTGSFLLTTLCLKSKNIRKLT